MPRTTVNIDDPIFRDLKRLQKEERKSLGRLISELLAVAIRARKAQRGKPVAFGWNSRPMEARVNIDDREAVWSVLDRDDEGPSAP